MCLCHLQQHTRVHHRKHTRTHLYQLHAAALGAARASPLHMHLHLPPCTRTHWCVCVCVLRTADFCGFALRAPPSGGFAPLNGAASCRMRRARRTRVRVHCFCSLSWCTMARTARSCRLGVALSVLPMPHRLLTRLPSGPGGPTTHWLLPSLRPRIPKLKP